MKKYLNYTAAALIVMSMFAGAGIVSAEYMGQVEKVAISPMPVPGNDQELNFTKLEISPRYGNARLKPGESKEMSVTIKNKEEKSVSLKPDIVIPPLWRVYDGKGVGGSNPGNRRDTGRRKPEVHSGGHYSC